MRLESSVKEVREMYRQRDPVKRKRQTDRRIALIVVVIVLAVIALVTYVTGLPHR